jgi:predicted cupin superfamily sugar epimerase
MMGDMRPHLADVLDLQPHPEGGWYRQTWVSPETVALPDGRVRATATLIHFLLPAGESSAWHRVASDEVWLAHTGSVVLELGGAGSRPPADGDAEVVVLGVDLAAGDVAQAVVPAGVWQRTVPGPGDALVSCLVSPGFDFADFELVAADDSGHGPAAELEPGAGIGVGPDLDEVQRASAGPEDGPVDPTAPTNPA